jgi:hypothetical protein
MRSSFRRLRPVGALVAAAALATAAGGSDAQSRQTLHVASVGSGVVTSADGRILCGRRCSARYERGAVVSLTARPARHFSFDRWLQGCVGSAPRCIVAVDRPTTVRALFTHLTANLDVAVSGQGTVVSDPSGIVCGGGSDACSARFPLGVPITLTGAPEADFSFGAWGGACSGSGSSETCQLSVEGPTEVAAAFRPDFRSPGTQTLFVSTENGATVASTPPGVNCPTTCDADFESGTLVTLHASQSVSWGVNCAGKSSTCILFLDDSTGVSARGSAPPPPPTAGFGVNVSVSGSGFVSGPPGIRCGGKSGTLLDCEGFYRRGVTLFLRAQPASKFAGWSGFCRGKKPRCTLRVTAPKIVLAAFRR